MHLNSEDSSARQSAPDPNGTRRAERSSAPPSEPEPWTVVRQVRTHGSRYLDTRVAPYGPHPMHAHDAPAIALLLRGALEVTYASGYCLAGDASERAGALVLPVGPAHRGRAGADGARVLFLALEPDRVATMEPSSSAVLASPSWYRSPRLTTLGRGIARELIVSDDAAALALEGLTLELLGALVRQRRDSARTGPPPPWLRRVRESIDDRYRDRALRIADLAEDAGIDPASLARAFRAHYGTTAGAYLREIRVRRAADALAGSSAALGQIALDSGFADQSHFTRVFGAVHGVTPRRWRALHGK
jgi:AraC family transcriptional regulator